MKSVKAVAVREPWASRIAAGEELTVFKGAKTSYRGEMLIVSEAEPTYALALADLIEIRPITPEDKAPLRRGYAWTFRDGKTIARFVVVPRNGVFNVDVPAGALPEEQQAPLVVGSPVVPNRGQAKTVMADEVRVARASVRRLSRAARDLTGEGQEAHSGLARMQGLLAQIEEQIDQLVYGMVTTDPFWRERLAPQVDVETRRDLGAGALPTSRVSRRLDVLLVDDDPKLARGLRRVLAANHEVRLAFSKQEALDRIREKVPNVLVCDYRLEWQSSEDLLEAVKTNYPAIRRVLYSFSRVEVWCDLLSRKLVDAVVSKTVPTSELLDALS